MSKSLYQPGDRIVVADRSRPAGCACDLHATDGNHVRTCPTRRDPSRPAMDETKGYRDSLTLKTHKPGAIVRVLTAYMGSGRFAPDGTEGLWMVVKELPGYGAGNDYKLARIPSPTIALLGKSPVDVAAELARVRNVNAGHYPASWDLICHASRLEPVS